MHWQNAELRDLPHEIVAAFSVTSCGRPQRPDGSMASQAELARCNNISISSTEIRKPTAALEGKTRNSLGDKDLLFNRRRHQFRSVRPAEQKL